MSPEVSLLLEHHFFPHIQISATPGFRPGNSPFGPPDLRSTLNVAKVSESPLRYQASLHVILDLSGREDLPYAIDIVCVGHVVFQIPPTDGKSPEAIVSSISHRLLFPAIRELVLSLTARQPWGQFSIGMANPPSDSQIATLAQPKRTSGARKPKSPKLPKV